jgi:hypothetical protein
MAQVGDGVVASVAPLLQRKTARPLCGDRAVCLTRFLSAFYFPAEPEEFEVPDEDPVVFVEVPELPDEVELPLELPLRDRVSDEDPFLPGFVASGEVLVPGVFVDPGVLEPGDPGVTAPGVEVLGDVDVPGPGVPGDVWLHVKEEPRKRPMAGMSANLFFIGNGSFQSLLVSDTHKGADALPLCSTVRGPSGMFKSTGETCLRADCSSGIKWERQKIFPALGKVGGGKIIEQ